MAFRNVNIGIVPNYKHMMNPIDSKCLFDSSCRTKPVSRQFDITDQQQLVKESAKGLHDAVYIAYAKHTTLGLQPDHVWITIMQSLATHIEKNKDKFQHLFKEETGDEKENLVVEIDYQDFNAFINGVANMLNQKIKFDPMLQVPM